MPLFLKLAASFGKFLLLNLIHVIGLIICLILFFRTRNDCLKNRLNSSVFEFIDLTYIFLLFILSILCTGLFVIVLGWKFKKLNTKRIKIIGTTLIMLSFFSNKVFNIANDIELTQQSKIEFRNTICDKINPNTDSFMISIDNLNYEEYSVIKEYISLPDISIQAKKIKLAYHYEDLLPDRITDLVYFIPTNIKIDSLINKNGVFTEIQFFEEIGNEKKVHYFSSIE